MSLYSNLLTVLTPYANKIKQNEIDIRTAMSLSGGAPIVVGSTSAMTDTDQIYVLSTDGNWYYHNGTAWTVGGEYGGVAAGSITTDKLADGAVTTAKIADGVISAVDAKYTDLEDFTDFALSDIRHVTDRTSEYIADHYIVTNTVRNTIDPTNIREATSNQKWAYVIFPVKKGDIVRYEGSQIPGSSTRCLQLTDENYLIYYSGSNASIISGVVQKKATKDGYCVSNAYTRNQEGKVLRYKIYHIKDDTYSDVLGGVAKVEDISTLTKRVDVPVEFTLVENEYVNSSGSFVSYTGWSRTDYIDVSSGTLRITNSSGTTSEYNFFYDENHSPIGSRFSFYKGVNDIAVPSTAKYVVLSAATSVMQQLVVNTGDHYMNLADRLPLTPAMLEEITKGDTSAGVPSGLVNPTAYLMKQLIPDYYFVQNEVPEDKHDIGYLDDKINSVPDGYHFIFVTDTHWIRNAKQSTKLISYVRDRIGAKIVLFGGDILTAHSTDAIAYRCLCEFVFDYKNAFGSNLLLAVGNHDLNSSGPNDASYLTYEDLVPIFMQGCDSRFHYCDYYDARIDELAISQGMTDDEKAKLKQYFRTCFWVDDIDGKTRYIIYNTGIGSLDGGSGIQQFISPDISGSYEELLVLEWVYETLMSVPEGYNIIFCSHIPASISMSGLGGTTPITSVRQAFATLIPSFKAKRVASVYISDRISNIEQWCSRSMTFDFSQAPTVGTIAVMGGHYHIDTFVRFGFSSAMNQSHTSGTQSEINQQELSVLQNSGTVTEGHYRYEIPIIITQYDAYSGQSTSGVPQHAMEINTITEQCFDVVTIRPNGDIALTRFGAGNDRYITIT